MLEAIAGQDIKINTESTRRHKTGLIMDSAEKFK